MAQVPVAPDARELLMRSGGAAVTANTLRMEGTESSELVYGASRQDKSGSFSVASSGPRTRSETKIGDNIELIVVDGTNRWRYNRSANEYRQSPAPTGPANDALGRIRFSRDPTGFRDAKILREETLEFGGRQNPCFIVYAAYRNLPGNSTARDVERTVWIAKSNDLVLRDVWDFALDSSASLSLGKSRLTTDYTTIEWDIPLSDDLFVFHPPEGSRSVTVVPPPPTPAGTSPQVRTSLLIHKVEPTITPEARAAGLQGTVSLYVEVGADGRPSQIEVMEGLGMGLDEQAVKAVQQWEYQPRPAVRGDILDALEVTVSYRLDASTPWFVESESFSVKPPAGQRIDEIVRPVATRYVAPDAAVCGATGRAVVRLTITKAGKPLDVGPAEGGGSVLVDAAVKAVRTWQFKPGTVNGAPMEAHGRIEFSCPAGEPEKAPATPGPGYRTGGAVSAPVLISKLEPEYSVLARKSKLQGTTTLYMQITPEGKATNIHVIKRLGMGLDQKAMESVKHWRFQPGMKDGKPVTVEATVEVNFRLL